MMKVVQVLAGMEPKHVHNIILGMPISFYPYLIVCPASDKIDG